MIDFFSLLSVISTDPIGSDSFLGPGSDSTSSFCFLDFLSSIGAIGCVHFGGSGPLLYLAPIIKPIGSVNSVLGLVGLDP